VFVDVVVVFYRHHDYDDDDDDNPLDMMTYLSPSFSH
jgi:hypothetical protein